MKRRVFLIVADSLGVGALPDAERFGDVGTHTLDHVVESVESLDVPRLSALGLGNVPGVRRLGRVATPAAAFGRMAEVSAGKDTSTGHWEMMGVVVPTAFPTFPEGFPRALVEAFVERAGLDGVLGNEVASGTEIIERLGPEHLRTGRPILYTSADSVFQLAAHEEHFGLERLLDCCRVARELLDEHHVARVIARPFVGAPGGFERTYNRRDFSLEPTETSSLVRLDRAGVPVIGVGKIQDIFAGVGVPRSVHTEGNRDGMAKTTELARTLENGLVFVNLVDFDMLFGHRRDPVGYARALEEFDRDLVAFERHLRPDDVVFVTADHGNDPTFTATTDHTREYVPVLAFGERVRAAQLGTRASFADLGATVEELFGLVPGGPGASFARELES
ncbi:MAG: phosphopentomutase [Planctomycetota bacterium]